jgi:circadian clock protein KaiC
MVASGGGFASFKCRGQDFRSGYHDFSIASGGVQLFPRLVAAEHRRGFSGELVLSGIEPLDGLLAGGLAAARAP